MSVYVLNEELVFPPPEQANEDGVLAVGGDASVERLILSYALGIFPWPHESLPLLWFCPDPRFVLEFERAHVGRSLRRCIRRQRYDVRVDTAFDEVIQHCARVARPGQRGTWISDELLHGFVALHRRGYAHSVEAWHHGALVGGLYGVSLGRVFFGESMFALAPDASKVATVAMLGNLRLWGFRLVDCQVYTENLARFGARSWPRARFLTELRRALVFPTRRGPWRFPLDPVQALAFLKQPATNPTGQVSAQPSFLTDQSER